MKPTIIGIAGGTASGKTTIAKRLYEEALKNGSVSLIRIDDYYYDKERIPLSENGKRNYDHPDSYDSNLIYEHLLALKKGMSINKPLYDFISQSRINKTETVQPSNVIIVEGMILKFLLIRQMTFALFVDYKEIW